MESHRAAPAALRAPEELSRAAKDRRLRKIVAKFNSEVEGYSQMDRRRIFKMIVKDDPEVLELYSENPLSEEDVIDMIHDGNLSDRQMLKVLAVLRRKWGRKVITPNIRGLLKEKKQLLDHLFTEEWLDKDTVLHFKDKDGRPIGRFVTFFNHDKIKLINFPKESGVLYRPAGADGGQAHHGGRRVQERAGCG
jgi:hypothetical protein